MRWLPWCFASAAAWAANTVLPIDPAATPPLVIPGADKGGTSDAFGLLIARAGFASRNDHRCFKPGASVVLVGKCRARSKELACLYRGGDAESWRRCYDRYVPRRGQPWIDATPNYLWGWLPAVDVASRLRELSPTSAVVVLLRDPVARLASLFNYWASQPIADELGPSLEAHVRSDLRYLAAMADAGGVWVATAKGRVVSETPIAFDGLWAEDGHETFGLLMRYYGRWFGADLEACDAVLGPKQKTKPSPWLDSVACRRDPACARRDVIPCPVFVNFVLTGIYAPLVQRWLALFPGRAAVVESEASPFAGVPPFATISSQKKLPEARQKKRYFADPGALLALFGVAADAADAAPHRVVNEGTYGGATTRRNATLGAALAGDLRAFYADPNRRLRAVLARAASSGAAAVHPPPADWTWTA